MPSRHRLVAIVVAIASAFGACYVDGEQSTTASAISDECAVEPSAVVARSTVFFTTLRAEGRFGCTATLIDNSHVLTAWHCHLGGPLPDDAVVMFAPSFSPNAPTRPVREFHAPGGGNDIAVARFDGDVPAGYEPVTLAGATIVDPGAAVVHAGYGQTTTTVNDRGVLRAGLSRFDSELPGSRVRVSSPGCGLCSGDSGGPDYVAVNGALRLLGVHVTGDCASSGTSTDVRRFVDWIFSTGAEPLVDINPVRADREIAL